MNNILEQEDKTYRIGIADSRLSHFYYRQACANLDADLIDDVTEAQIRKGLELDLCIITGEYSPDQVLLLGEAKRRRIPTLHVMDGMLEWRNTWENPNLISPLLQPVLADKIACIGRSQARILESWGNTGKCEIVGSPRHDYLLGCEKKKPGDRDNPTLLVCSARTPWFTETQKVKVLQAFTDLRERVAAYSTTTGRPVNIQWRISESLRRELEVAYENSNLYAEDILDVMQLVDAMITTPSTVMLDGMLYGLPVATLDYCNSPQYTQSAWSITAPDHFDEVLAGLFAPSQSKLLVQDYYLHDALECGGPSGPRLKVLVEAMLCIGRDSRRSGSPLNFPPDILAQFRYVHRSEPRHDLARLYPDEPLYSETDRGRLECELKHSRARLAQLQDQSEQKSDQLSMMYEYGFGPLIPRLVYTFPSFRKMKKTVGFWWAAKKKRWSNQTIINGPEAE